MSAYRPFFSSGPCAKRLGWTLDGLQGALLSRGHRSPEVIGRIQEVLALIRAVLALPEDYQIAIIPGSTTGAFESGLWSLLGPRGVDVWVWDVFGGHWAHDCEKELKLPDLNVVRAPYGTFPALHEGHPDRDQVFVWCGTTTGVWVPGEDALPPRGEGLLFCDATSAAFGVRLPWHRLDATAFSFQKCLGGEAGIGILILSPRALQRLSNYTPPWPIPRLFRMKDAQGAITHGLFRGEAINTPSLLTIEDALGSLKWAQAMGGSAALEKKTQENFAVLQAWVERTPTLTFMAKDPRARAKTAVTLEFVPLEGKSDAEKWGILRPWARQCELEGIGYDLINHPLSKPGLRIWCGPTMETTDLESLTQKLDVAFSKLF